MYTLCVLALHYGATQAVHPMGVREQFLNLSRFHLDSGNQIRFWEGWATGQLNMATYLFDIVQRKQATVADLLNSSPINLYFKRRLVGNKLSGIACCQFVDLEEQRYLCVGVT